jgi:integral membrane sensor domain MASE1
MQQFRLTLLVIVLWMVAALLSRSLASAATETVPVWLGSGVTFAALMVSQRWSWPAVLAGAALASFAWGIIAHKLGIEAALVFAAIELVCMGVGAWVATLGRHDPESPVGARWPWPCGAGRSPARFPHPNGWRGPSPRRSACC